MFRFVTQWAEYLSKYFFFFKMSSACGGIVLLNFKYINEKTTVKLNICYELHIRYSFLTFKNSRKLCSFCFVFREGAFSKKPKTKATESSAPADVVAKSRSNVLWMAASYFLHMVGAAISTTLCQGSFYVIAMAVSIWIQEMRELKNVKWSRSKWHSRGYYVYHSIIPNTSTWGRLSNLSGISRVRKKIEKSPK